jgi:hypothetical protein
MRFICLGYADEKRFASFSPSEAKAMMEECFAYDDVLRKHGHFAGGEALQNSQTARTLRWEGGKVAVTDGPYAETKEQLGGVLLLEARDMNHAIELMSKHPGVRFSPFEIRPANDDTESCCSLGLDHWAHAPYAQLCTMLGRCLSRSTRGGSEEVKLHQAATDPHAVVIVNGAATSCDGARTWPFPIPCRP